MSFSTGQGTNLDVILGDLLQMPGTGALVIPVNTWLYLNGGLARQAAKKAGPSLESTARRSSPLPIGNAILMADPKLSHPLILSPTVNLPVDAASGTGVTQATRAALRCADANGIVELFFPAMGAGTGGVPYDECANRMVHESWDYLRITKSKISHIVFVAQSPLFLESVKRALGEVAVTIRR